MEQKAKTFFYGILAVFTFSLVLGACPGETPSKPAIDPPPVLRLSLSGQVYTQDIDLENIDYAALVLGANLASINKYNESLGIDDGGMGGIGEIKDGKFSYIIETPPLSPIGESLNYLKEMYSGLNFSPKDANAAAVVLQITDNEEYSGLLKGLLDIRVKIIKPDITITVKTVNYVYVDKALNITADPFSYEYTDPELPFPIGLTTDKINLGLREGWNSLYSEITAQMDIPPELILILMNPAPDSPDPDLTVLRPKGKLKMSVGDPGNLNWTLIPSQSSDDIEPQYPEPFDFE